MASSTKGRIILLNGASSSGKSTLARHLQAAADIPFLILSSDQLVDGGALPPQRSSEGNPGNPFSWPSTMRPKFFSGFHRCIQGMALAGNDLIVDHIVEYADWWSELDELLRGLDVWTVNVVCDVEEIERREIARGNRRVGEGREHLERNRVLELRPSSFQVITTQGVTQELAKETFLAWQTRPRELQ